MGDRRLERASRNSRAATARRRVEHPTGRGTARRSVRGCEAGGDRLVTMKNRRARGADTRNLNGLGYTLLAVVMLMSLYGMVMIFSASSGAALQHYGSSYYFLLRQTMWFGAGLVALLVLARLDYRRLVELSPFLVAVSLVALLAVLLFGNVTYGSRRSLNIGPLVIQPSELAKMSLLLFAVHYWGRRRGRLDSWREICLPVLAVTALACLLIILEPDLGSTLIVGFTVFAVLFLAGAPWRRIAVLALGGTAVTLLFIFTSGYRRARFLAFLDPWSAPRGRGFHIIQSMVALGSGRVTGLGLGMSRQKFFYLPNAHNDFIFSIIGEELGLVGTLTVLVLLALFLYLGLKIARQASDETGRLLAMGITCVLGAQAVVNMGGATGVLPITGITLPFISYGGSSLVICLCLTGILLNVSRQGGKQVALSDRRKRNENSHLRRRDGRSSAPVAGSGRGARIA